jgi:hypothetical protein
MKDIGGALAVLGIGVAGFYVFISSTRSLTPLESVLLQLMSLAFSLVGSFLLGRRFTKGIPSARSAFRRLQALYHGLSIIAAAIESSRTSESIEEYRNVMSLLEGLVCSQLVTADDALEDWKDIVPEDVADLQQCLDAAEQSER